MASKIDTLTQDQLDLLKEVAEEVDSNIDRLKEEQKKRWDVNHVEHDYAKKIEEQKDWQERGKASRVRDFVDQAVEDHKEKVKGAQTTWELKGAAWTILILSIFGGCFYYFCIRRKNLRN